MRYKEQTHFKDAIKRKRSGGFALVALLTMTPVLLTVFFATASIALLAREHTRTQTLCKNHLFNMQDNISILLNKLMGLNSKAQTLRIRYKRAQMQFQMAALTGNPARIAQAEARLMQIEFERVALDTEQKGLITQANTIIQTSKIKLQHELNKQQAHINSNNLAVQPDILNDTAPIYKTEPNFRQAQLARARYTWQLPMLLRVLKNQQTDFQFTCAVSIEKRLTLYRATLVEDV